MGSFCPNPKSIWKKKLQQNCKTIAKKLQNNCKKVAKNLQKICKKIAKNLQKNCKKIAKKLQNNCKNFAKCTKKFFLLCKMFANFLQILNLHTDFRQRE